MRRPLHVALSLFPLLLLVSCAGREVKPVPVAPPPKAAKVAVVLGGGSAKGFAHVGVLKILEANRVPVHMVVGTSVGSLVGCLYAYGYPAYDLQKVAMGLEKGELADLTVPDNGFVKGEKLESYVNRMVRDTPMERLRTPFYAVATDIGSGQETVFGKGNTGSAVRASCAIPGVFRPVRIGDRTYVDGGLVSPVAVDAARRMGATVVIAVDITGDVDGSVPEGTLDTIFQSINVMYAKIAADQLSRADVVIRPKVGYIASGDFTKRHEAILEGEKAAQEALPKIQALLAEPGR
jgi:NTE family protein